jgi:hypothetical protein
MFQSKSIARFAFAITSLLVLVSSSHADSKTNDAFSAWPERAGQYKCVDSKLKDPEALRLSKNTEDKDMAEFNASLFEKCALCNAQANFKVEIFHAGDGDSLRLELSDAERTDDAGKTTLLFTVQSMNLLNAIGSAPLKLTSDLAQEITWRYNPGIKRKESIQAVKSPSGKVQLIVKNKQGLFYSHSCTYEKI